MPKGNPKAQTIASDKYQKKVGIIVKGFKLKRELADEFAQACERAGKSQASVISDFMREFIDNN
jgi:hypothetical protein